MSEGSIVVIGGGHNGLTAACLLAKRGEKVILLEARAHAGGLAASEHFAEGYRVPGILHDTRGVRDAIVDALGLERFGLKRESEPLRICAPSEEGEPLWISDDAVEGSDEQAAYRRFRAFIARVRPALSALLDREPPEPTRELWPLLQAGLRVRRLGASDMFELLRVAPMCVADWMRDSFASERLSAALALPAMEGGFVGPWSPGTAALLLLREAAAGRAIAGGPAALVDALVQAAASYGVEVRTDSAVTHLELGADHRAVTGVTLASGERIPASRVLATCDPKQLFSKLIGAERLPVLLAEDARRLRARGTTAKLHLGLSGALELADGTVVEALRTGETLDDLERAFDPAKYGELPSRPALDVWVPSMRDPSLVDERGHQVVSILVHQVTHDLAGGWDAALRERLADSVVAELARYCPALANRIVAREVLAPPDLAERYRLTQGHIHHAEHALDQLHFMRPTVDCAKYASPIAGLYLGGSGSHPGGGITCAPGALAARAMLR
jgi:phytoene dehydrogenase-like protein